jgi:hypothetical protein
LFSCSLPDNLTNLGTFAFYASSLTNINIPNKLAAIADGTFENCSITNGLIPDSVISIGQFAFGNCTLVKDVRLGNNVANIGYYAFGGTGITNIRFPSSLTNIGGYAFECYTHAQAYFMGNAPNADSTVFNSGDIVFYMPGTTGWGTTFGGVPAVLWNPQAQTTDGSFGILSNQFGFNITGTSNIPIVVEASTDLASSPWTALQSCTLTNGSIYFSDPNWTNYPARLYRMRSP